MHKKSQVKKIFREFSRIFTVQHRNLFRDSNFPKSYLPPIRGYSWHKNEIKMIRIGHYSSNNFQDSTKRKSTESKKYNGLSPKSSFFKAIKIGIVILKDAHVKNKSWSKREHQKANTNTFFALTHFLWKSTPQSLSKQTPQFHGDIQLKL